MKDLRGFGAMVVLTAVAGVGATGLVTLRPAPAGEMERLAASLPAGMTGVAACFAPGTDPEYIAEVQAELFNSWGIDPNQRFFAVTRWPGSQGTPVNLTYSFAPDGLTIPSGVGEGSGTNEIFARLNSQFAGNTALWKQRFQEGFDAWAAVTGNTYTEVSDDGAAWGAGGSPGLRGDVRISMKNIDGASNTLAYDGFPPSSDMVLDRAENWASGATELFLRNVVSHEHGHGLGFAHACPSNSSKLMEPGLSLAFVGPQQDEIRGAHFLYGDPLETATNNNNIANATDLDAMGLSFGTPFLLTNILSLHFSSDTDFFKFTSTPGALVDVRVTPVGSSYLNGPQNGDGSCSPGSNLDALRQQNLAIDILNSGGGTIATINIGGLGDVENMIGANVSTPGTYYIRVYSVASAGNTQRYDLRVELTAGGVFGDINGDGCVNSTDLGILLGSWGPSGGLADLDGDGDVDSQDLAQVLGSWGSGIC